MTKAVAQRCSVKKVFLLISENSQGNTCARVLAQNTCARDLRKRQENTCARDRKTLAQETSEISKNIFSYRTPPVAASTMRD